MSAGVLGENSENYGPARAVSHHCPASAFDAREILMEMAYPLAQEDVLAPLIRWLNDQRKRAYHITERPDVAERRQQAVDYVLRDDASGHEAAVEVSTV